MEEQKSFLNSFNKYESHSCSGSATSFAQDERLPSQSLAKMLYDTANKRCALTKILNTEWEAAAGGPAMEEWARNRSSAVNCSGTSEGERESVWAAADALCSFISYKHWVGRKEASALHPPRGAPDRGRGVLWGQAWRPSPGVTPPGSTILPAPHTNGWFGSACAHCRSPRALLAEF